MKEDSYIKHMIKCDIKIGVGMLTRVVLVTCHVAPGVLWYPLLLPARDGKTIHVGQWWIVWATLNQSLVYCSSVSKGFTCLKNFITLCTHTYIAIVHKDYGNDCWILQEAVEGWLADFGCAGRMKGLAFIKDPDGYWIEIFDVGHMTRLMPTSWKTKAATQLTSKN